MNSIGEMIAYHDQDYLLLTRPDQVRLQVGVLLYLFKGCSAQQLSDDFKDTLNWSGQDCIDFRKKIWESGYLLKNLKLYFYAKANGERVRAEDFGITLADIKFVSRILKSSKRTEASLCHICRKAYREGYRAHGLEKFDRGLNIAITFLLKEAYVQKFVGRKFQFLTQSGQRDSKSLAAEMFEYALRSVYHAYPRIDNMLHLVNIMKTGIHNRGQNIIKEETTQKRKRVVRNEDGTFAGNLLSLDFSTFEQTFALEQFGTGGLNTCNSLMCGLDGQSAEYERPTDVDRRRDLREAVDKFMDSVRGKGPKQFMNLLMGVHDEEFSEWLGQPNDEAASKMDRLTYAENVRRFMKVPKPIAKSFVLRMRTAFADFRN